MSSQIICPRCGLFFGGCDGGEGVWVFGICKFPGQESNPRHSSNPRSDNTKFLTHYTTKELLFWFLYSVLHQFLSLPLVFAKLNSLNAQF